MMQRSPEAPGYRVLVYSRTAGFRHESIPDGIELLTRLGADHGFAVDATEDGTHFTPDNLAHYRLVVFLSTTQTVLDAAQKAAFQGYVRGGGGFVGIHAAADTEYDWPWYRGLVGAWFASHPAQQPATIRVADPDTAATAHLPRDWHHFDEWYNYRTNPRPDVHVLATVDETTYDAGDGAMGEDHPIAWCHRYDGSRVFYTGLGHTRECYTDPLFADHVLGGIRMVAGEAAWPTS